MANRLITGILILLVIVMGGAGYYSYTLNERIGDLSERLTTFEIEQTARVDAVGDELSKLRTETLQGLGDLKGQIEESLGEIDVLEAVTNTLGAELESAENRISGVEGEIGGITTEVENLDERITDTEGKTSSILDASAVYQTVSQATVRITNGLSTVPIGSGVIFDGEGHVLTAHHVIDGLFQIYVMMHDGSVSTATIVGYSEFSDIAVLELDNIPSVEPPPLADSSLIEVGEPVVVLGSPLDLRDTLTVGVISQVNRFQDIEGSWIPNLIQFDAAANFGNSGGPLFNAKGEIIGIVIARVSPTEGDGINYAVSSNKAKRVAEALIASGSFDYPWIGIGIVDISPLLVEEMSLETSNGVYVGSVFTNSPAEAAGIEVGDIVLAMDGVPIRDSAELTSYLGEYKSPGDTAVITLLRNGNEIEISIEVGTRE